MTARVHAGRSMSRVPRVLCLKGAVAIAVASPIGCGSPAQSAPSPTAPTPATVAVTLPAVDAGSASVASAAEAARFVADVEQHLRTLWVERDRANWIHDTFITDDTETLASKYEEDTAAYLREATLASRRFANSRSALAPDVARKLYLLPLAQTIPAPADPEKRRELANLETRMTGTYAKGTYCPPTVSALGKKIAASPRKGSASDAASGSGCLRLEDLSRVLATSRDDAELSEAWAGWYAIAKPMRPSFEEYVRLANDGARELGYADVGALWRAGYDMDPDALAADVDRLWGEVRPLYEAIHCYVRSKLRGRYGASRVPEHGPIPAELLGNMWAQDWTNVLDLVLPYPSEPPPDVTRALKAQHWDAQRMVRQGERFFTGLGFEPLPATFWQRSQFVRPRDREVVCHASAWDVGWDGDLRVKMCIEPTEEDLVTIHHELGHDFYFQQYDTLPILFQQGANDGFHEAVGDTMALSVTPSYLAAVGLAAPPHGSAVHARVNQQLKMALEKVAFLPFGLLMDKWRWDVFSGAVSPNDYNARWWQLVAQYQGVAPPAPRHGDDFDPGAKFHIASSTPYLRYFLARIYQFQFHKALCAAAGASGPLDACSIADNKAAGATLKKMLALGGSRPWPEALEAIGAGSRADAGPMLEYFRPLSDWLATQNAGRSCGW